LDRHEINAGKRQRRNWTPETKARVVAAMLMPGANVSDIARQYDISRQHIYLWRKAALARQLPWPADQEKLREKIVVARASTGHRTTDPSATVVEIEVSGFVVRASPGVDLALLANVLQALKT
jgi:transposase